MLIDNISRNKGFFRINVKQPTTLDTNGDTRWKLIFKLLDQIYVTEEKGLQHGIRIQKF